MTTTAITLATRTDAHNDTITALTKVHFENYKLALGDLDWDELDDQGQRIVKFNSYKSTVADVPEETALMALACVLAEFPEEVHPNFKDKSKNGWFASTIEGWSACSWDKRVGEVMSKFEWSLAANWMLANKRDITYEVGKKTYCVKAYRTWNVEDKLPNKHVILKRKEVFEGITPEIEHCF